MFSLTQLNITGKFTVQRLSEIKGLSEAKVDKILEVRFGTIVCLAHSAFATCIMQILFIAIGFMK